MPIKIRVVVPTLPAPRKRRMLRVSSILGLAVIVLPVAVLAQSGGTPFDTGFTAIQTLFTGTVAKVTSLVAIVIGGNGFAHGEPGAKKIAW